MLRTRRPQEKGQVLIIFALFMALLFFSLIAFVLDLSVMYTASTRAHSAALIAAVSGANDINLSTLANTGQVTLASNAIYTVNGALSVCAIRGNSVGGHGTTTTCSAPNPLGPSGEEVTATVKVPANLPIPVPAFGSWTGKVTATAHACPVSGTGTALTSYC